MGRILVVDDEAGIRNLLRSALEARGHAVVEAENGRVAVQAYRADPKDLVIMDLFMPEKEGLRAIVELRRDFPDIKIIAISGGGSMGRTDLLTVMKDFGVAHAFAKPFQMADMLGAVDALLD